MKVYSFDETQKIMRAVAKWESKGFSSIQAARKIGIDPWLIIKWKRYLERIE